MTTQLVAAGALAGAGVVCLVVAIIRERRMHRHRQPGVTYREATFRRDGGWRRAELFTEQGLEHQRHASLWGVSGAVLLVAALVAWMSLGTR